MGPSTVTRTPKGPKRRPTRIGRTPPANRPSPTSPVNSIPDAPRRLLRRQAGSGCPHRPEPRAPPKGTTDLGDEQRSAQHAELSTPRVLGVFSRAGRHRSKLRRSAARPEAFAPPRRARRQRQDEPRFPDRRAGLGPMARESELFTPLDSSLSFWISGHLPRSRKRRQRTGTPSPAADPREPIRGPKRGSKRAAVRARRTGQDGCSRRSTRYVPHSQRSQRAGSYTLIRTSHPGDLRRGHPRQPPSLTLPKGRDTTRRSTLVIRVERACHPWKPRLGRGLHLPAQLRAADRVGRPAFPVPRRGPF